MKGNNERKYTQILFFTLIVIMLGFGMVLPLMPFYIQNLGARGKELGMLTAIYSITQFIFSPIWGILSDKVGRKPILVVGILGNGIFLLLFGFASQLWMLFFARALAGALSSATLPTAMAYISDTRPPDERGSGIGKLGAAVGLGMIFGPGLGGWLANHSLTTPFLVAAGLSIFALLLVVIFLPESLQPDQQQKSGEIKSENTIVRMYRAISGPAGILFFMAFLVSFGMTNFQGIFSLYTIQKFNFTPNDVGTVLVIVGLVSAIVQGVLTGPLSKKVGETLLVKFCLIAISIGFLVILQSNSYLTILITSGLFMTPVSLLMPLVSTLIANRTTAGQGSSMGLSNAFSSLGRIIGPLCAGFLFDIDMDLPFISGAVILFLGFFISMLGLKKEQQTNAYPEYSWGND
jgi:DHA1 family multidrug resistance protein-like MFS transporter